MKLPIISGREVVKILTRLGFKTVGRKGSHICLKKKNEQTFIVIVPHHRELARDTLRAILWQANLKPEEFLNYYKTY
ncbi:MAG: type II toxin-antitoxin system HicA family toxin [Candidatus Heimdallarchaeota archaeon]